jgi:isopenicillin N synthase-like dioxygenase
LRLLHYPNVAAREACAASAVVVRGALHTDYGTLTLLTQDQTGGLRVQRRDGTWTFLRPIPGGIVVNVGDMLQRWTNDVLRATPHQVVEHPDHARDDIPERFSVAFFCNANKDVLLEPLEFLSDQPPKYPPINALEYD